MILEREKEIYSVSEITSSIKTLLEMHFTHIAVSGEISNFRPASSGHYYFQLSDKESTISVVMFKSSAYRLSFSPKDGDKVVVKGSISLYSPRGSYQIIATSMSLSGTGDILILLEKRKQHYAKLGYFDQSRKRELPKVIKKIGVITSDTGAAIQDILHVLNRRNKSIDVVIFPTLVQGNTADMMISKRIRQAQRMKDLDVLIITRGGGSVEDLLPFSEEAVIEAIYESKIITISAVGHEIDNSLSDYVADVRSPTPSAAAEIVSSSSDEILTQVISKRDEMIHRVSYTLNLYKNRITQFSTGYVAEKVEQKIHLMRLKNDDLITQMVDSVLKKIALRKRDYDVLFATLMALSPYTILERGYSIVTKGSSPTPIKDAADLLLDDNIEVTFHKGKVNAQIQSITNKG